MQASDNTKLSRHHLHSLPIINHHAAIALLMCKFYQSWDSSLIITLYQCIFPFFRPSVFACMYGSSTPTKSLGRRYKERRIMYYSVFQRDAINAINWIFEHSQRVLSHTLSQLPCCSCSIPMEVAIMKADTIYNKVKPMIRLETVCLSSR